MLGFEIIKFHITAKVTAFLFRYTLNFPREYKLLFPPVVFCFQDQRKSNQRSQVLYMQAGWLHCGSSGEIFLNDI